MPNTQLVRDLMTVGVPTCKWNTPVRDIARFLLEHHVEAMCVLDAEGHGIGVVGEEELVAAYGQENLDSLKAEDIMSEGVPELGADIPLAVAAPNSTEQLLNAGRGHQAPRKAAHCLRKEVGQNIKYKKRDKRGRVHPGKGVLKKK